MGPANVSQSDISIDDEAEILALEKLLGEAENDNAENAKSAPAPPPPTLATAVPRLREDSSFADAFSYEVTVKPTQTKAQPKLKSNEPELDSSDDEEVKNFLERKYNEYGSDINKKLKQQRESAHESKVAREVDQSLRAGVKLVDSTAQPEALRLKNPHNPIQRKALASNSFQRPPQAAAAAATSGQSLQKTTISAIYTDPVFGLRMINPLISSTLLQERMDGRKSVPFSGLAFHIERGDLSKDWVIAGALVSKQPVRNTKKGDPYSTWRLSDLRGEMKTASIFLFKEAHKALWKTAEGMCLAVLNPTIFEKRAGSNDVACLSIDTSQKVMILGQSKDLGTCRATKKNGDKCTSLVNLTDCDYCVFHVKQEFGKMSRRSELQSATTGRGLNELRNKVLGKSEVFYGGQSFSAVPARKSAKLINKERERLSKLAGYDVSPFSHSVDHESKPRSCLPVDVPYAERGGPVSRLAGIVEATSKQRYKDLERLRQLRAESDRFEQAPAMSQATPATPTTPTTKEAATPTTPQSVPEKFKNRGFSFDASLTPKLAGSENFSFEVNIGARQAQSAKLKAAALLKKKPLEKVNPNSTRGTATGKRRAIDELHDKFSTSGKRQKLEEEEREIMRKSRIERIMAATSSHTNLVELREREAQSDYFDKLERKEAMEEKMLSTYKMPCKAVICQRCKYTAFAAAERCKEEKHPLKVVDAQKRFFQCKDCGNRTTTVFKLPKHSCSSCKGSRWERTAMIRERKVCTGREALSVRGDEETFLGSVASAASLNLLVPEEE
ncbi:protein MCM10 homolog [Drosophila novamexicana]|uniref:protein MCM10 homolog n=1 Tax=Drosophila novamexicana TaxID=47314 RepID=UPI0011E5D3EC|nr:protein MCM10 homolog [Drosophila novamexicana]